MTKVYNVTNYGIARQLEEKLDKVEIVVQNNTDSKRSNNTLVILDNNYIDQLGHKPNNNKIIYYKVPSKPKANKFIELTKKDLIIIAKIINEKVFFMFPKLKEIYEYFIDVAKLMIILKIPLNWFTPSGVKVTQDYLKTSRKSVSMLTIGQKSRTLVIRKVTGDSDVRKQAQAIIPNIIHSGQMLLI